MIKRASYLVVLFATAMALFSCGGGKKQETGGQTPGATPGASTSQIVVASVTTPPTIDMDFVSGAPQGWEIGYNIYDTLFGYQGQTSAPGDHTVDYSKIVGRAVESWELASDNVTWTLHLRHGVKSADGQDEMTAADVKYTLDRSIALGATGMYVAAAVNLTKPDSIQVVDDYTVQIKLDSYSPFFLERYTMVYPGVLDSKVVQQHATADDPWAAKWLGTHSAGYGPYYVSEFTSGQQVVLKANPNYWQGVPAIGTVIYKSVPDASSRLSLLKGGDVDIALNLSPDQNADAKATNGITVYDQKPANTFIAIAMNEKMAPFDNVLVRQALAYAIPYDDIINNVYKGFAAKADSYLPPTFPDHVSGYWPYTYDANQAKTLLAQAGYPNGFKTTLTFAELSPAEQNVAIAIQSALAQINVTMDLNIVSPAVSQKAINDRSEPMIMYTANSHNFDGAFAMQQWVSSGPVGGLNAGNYNNPTLEALFDSASKETDTQTRHQDIVQMQDILAHDMPWLMAAIEDYVAPMKSDIKGFEWMPYASILFWTLHY